MHKSSAFSALLFYFKEVFYMASKEEIKAALNKAAVGGKLPCAKAFQLAEELGVPRKEIGNMANELKIKISACQLGCFK